MRCGFLRLAAVLLIACGPVVAGQMPLAQPDVAGFPDIQLYVAPTGERGEPITGAKAEDFEVREDGRTVPLAAFRDTTHGAPVDVCLTIDRSGSMIEQGKLQSAQEAARIFLRSLRPEDRAALVSFADRATLNRSLTRDADGVAQAAAALHAYGATALYDAVFWSVNQVALEPRTQGTLVTPAGRLEARRVVLALTDGNDNRSRITPGQVVRLARANGITIYTIGLGSDAQADALAWLARMTGGRFFQAPGPEALAQLYALIARQLHSEYGLRYQSPNPRRDGTRRTVSVRLRTPAGPLDAQGWYQSPGAGSSVIAVAPPASSGTSGPALPGEPLAPGGAPVPLVKTVIPLLGVAVFASAVAAAFLLYRSRALRGNRSSQHQLATEDTESTERGAAVAGSQVGTLPVGDNLEPSNLQTCNSEALSVSSVASPSAPRSEITIRLDLRPLWVRAPATGVGRAEENDLVLDSPRVSRHHARIEVAGVDYRLVDIGSANGTFLNGERVTEAPIAIGDVISFADQEFRFAGEEGA